SAPQPSRCTIVSPATNTRSSQWSSSWSARAIATLARQPGSRLASDIRSNAGASSGTSLSRRSPPTRRTAAATSTPAGERSAVASSASLAVLIAASFLSTDLSAMLVDERRERLHVLVEAPCDAGVDELAVRVEDLVGGRHLQRRAEERHGGE